MSEMKPVDDFDIVTYGVVNVNDPNSEPLFTFCTALNVFIFVFLCCSFSTNF